MWSGLLTSDHLYALSWYCLSSDHLFATCIVLRLSDQDFWSSLCNVNCLGIVGSGFQSSKSFYLTFSSPLHHQWKFLATLSSLVRYMYIQEVQCQLRRRQPARWSQHIFARPSSFWLSLFTVSLRAWLLVCFSIMFLLLFLLLLLVLFFYNAIVILAVSIHILFEGIVVGESIYERPVVNWGHGTVGTSVFPIENQPENFSSGGQ